MRGDGRPGLRYGEPFVAGRFEFRASTRALCLIGHCTGKQLPQCVVAQGLRTGLAEDVLGEVVGQGGLYAGGQHVSRVPDAVHAGLVLGDAGDDIRELRNLLEAWRKTRHTAWHTIIKASTIGLLTIFAVGAAIKFKLTGGAP